MASLWSRRQSCRCHQVARQRSSFSESDGSSAPPGPDRLAVAAVRPVPLLAHSHTQSSWPQRSRTPLESLPPPHSSGPRRTAIHSSSSADHSVDCDRPRGGTPGSSAHSSDTCDGKQRPLRVGEKGKSVERVRLEGRSGEYQWEVFHRAVRGERLEGKVTPEEIVAGLRIIKTMRRAEVSGKTEAVSQRLAGEVP